MSCLDETTVARFVAGEVSPAEAPALEAHLDGCAACRSLLAAVARAVHSAPPAPSWQPPEASPPAHRSPSFLLPGESVGRYLIEERIGAGGMGTVYAASDPELGRRVAIKVLRPEAFGAGGVAEGRARLRREAQALASLSHPNIVAVHDVGTHEDQVFVAMELVEGVSLSRWLREGSRSWSEVREVMLQAGRGLAAAHAAGLVHRDFKPDNVLVGADARVRVTDFGLARSTAPSEAGERPTSRDGGDSRAGDSGGLPGDAAATDLTRTGMTVGTPAYMAPEQHRGGAIDPRTDQFAFCIVLFEALCGERPFPGDSVEEIAKAVLEGDAVALPKDARLPAWLARVVARGLRTDPNLRYPSMDPLLADLAYDPSRARRRVVAAVAGALAVAIVAGLAWALASREANPCKTLGKQLSGIWDEPARVATRRAFLATGKPYAEKAWQGAAAVLDGYAKRWVAARRRACEALRATPGAPARTRTVQCLDGRRAELRAVSEAFARADARTAERALVTAHGLGRLASCEDSRRVPPPEPEDPGTRAKVEAVRATLARARILSASGRYEKARAVASPAVIAARRIGYAPLEAEALYRLGEAQMRLRRVTEARRTLRDAVLAAEGSRHDEVSARAQVLLVWVVGYLQEKTQEVEPIVQRTEAALRRIGGDPDIEARLAAHRASIASRAHRIPEALRHARRSLALRERLYGTAHPLVASSLQGLAITYARAGRYDEALPHFQRILTIRERTLGPLHPLVAKALTNLGILHRRAGRLEKALLFQRRAARISRAVLGPNDPGLASDLHNLGNTLYDLGKTVEAGKAYGEALAIRSRVLRPGHPRTLHSLSGTGLVARALGRPEEAARIHRRVVAGLARVRGRNSPGVAEELSNLAAAQLRQRRFREARDTLKRALAILQPRGRNYPGLAEPLTLLGKLERAEGRVGEAERIYRRVLAILRQAHGERHWRVAQVLVRLGEIQLEAHRSAEPARKLAEQAVSIVGNTSSAALVGAAARFLLARSLWVRNPDRPRAIALGRQALASLRGRSGEAGRLRARIEGWLAPRARDAAP